MRKLQDAIASVKTEAGRETVLGIAQSIADQWVNGNHSTVLEMLNTNKPIMAAALGATAIGLMSAKDADRFTEFLLRKV